MSLAQQVRGWTGGIGVWRKLAISLAGAALASGLATYLALTGAPPFGPRPTLVLSLLNLDLVLLLALAAVVAKRLFEVRAERRRNLAGSRLQVRLVGLFSLSAVLPPIMVAVFSYLFFSFGVESWFSDKVRTAISESVAVADAYVREHQQAIRADALAMAADLDRSAATLAINPQYLAPALTAQAAIRSLTEAAVVDRRGQMVARTGLAFALGFEDVSQGALRRANQGEVVIMTNDQDERVRALVRLGEFSELYLYVGRFIEPRVLAHRDEVHLAAAQYERLEGQRSGFQITFAVIYILVALLFLAAAISIGIHFAAKLGDPISRLMGAAERIRAEQDETGISGFVVTFDDITELLSAQRKAAWADIARRIAHEIKNPLTPIQLSAERLRRKYLRDIKKDADTFRICTDTIIRHVEDIGRLVDEFSSFARMLAPVLKPEDLTTLVEQAVFLQRTANPEMAFETSFASRPVTLRCDARLVSQALINIVKNAIESIEGRIVEGHSSPAGWISVAVGESEGRVSIAVEDNGKGLPQHDRERLTEPYVTTRAKGTGLGLAIVKKIMEDHEGELVLEDREAGGARVTLVFAGDARLAARSRAADPAAELSPVSHGA